MDVLNTTGGSVDIGGIVSGIACILVAIYAGCCAFDALMKKAHGFGIIFTVLTAIAAIIGTAMLYADPPVRHEVILRPGHVIDATRYEVVEQRGKIYVIEEREAPAE
ncbi:hypothetical protein GCM10008915_36770 [Bifidobacterium pullorum subsp. gallinarum]